ncbi:hypothetical protein [Aquimarina spongiae]|uniref:Uncharacterized protein n=1 Tax=Aquimarina spongiae TaxID=570521 RepID=A0A1M6AEV6_9FLAO|nr:hypothetical protein [Aquimarina spongiae]SHI35005.1 hypothetical protein SAMN04488508_101258 [Aquimarina spongiae]
MTTFLLILIGLIAFNFVLLRFSMQSVDGRKKKAKAKGKINHINTGKAKSSEIQTAA